MFMFTAFHALTRAHCASSRFCKNESKREASGSDHDALPSSVTLATQQVRTVAPNARKAATNPFRSYASDTKPAPTEVSSILEQRIRGVSEEASLAETGRVLSVGYVFCANN